MDKINNRAWVFFITSSVKNLFLASGSAVWLLIGVVILRNLISASGGELGIVIDIILVSNLIFYVYLPCYWIVNTNLEIMEFNKKERENVIVNGLMRGASQEIQEVELEEKPKND